MARSIFRPTRVHLAGHSLLVCLVLAGLLGACHPSVSARAVLTPLTIQLKWTHSAQFAGFYYADQHGYYTAEGLAVTFLEGGPEVPDLIAPVVGGRAQLGLSNADALIVARSRGQPVRALAAILRRSPAAFFALAESGITRPQDFAGKTIFIQPRSRAILAALLGKVGLTLDAVTVVNDVDYLTALPAGEVDVAYGFINDQAARLALQGHRLTFIYPEDYGLHFYSDTIFATEAFIVEQPEAVRSFLRASLRGWAEVVTDVEAGAALTRGYAPEVDTAFETAKLRASLPLILTDDDRIGWMTPQAWQGMEASLRQQGVLTQALDVSQAYDLLFLQEYYGP